MEYSELELKCYVRKMILSNQVPLSSISITIIDNEIFGWSSDYIEYKPKRHYNLPASGKEHIDKIKQSGFDREIIRIRRHLNVTAMLRNID